jgi:hypothetical protein
MKAAPGAQLPIGEIFGRDLLIAELWRLLESNSLRMEAERRIGKTSILHKMEAEPAAGWEPVSLDLEHVHSAVEFAERVSDEVHRRLTGWKRQANRLHTLLSAFGGGGIGPIQFPEGKDRPDGYWKRLLTGAIEDLVEQQSAVGKRVVFLFDEMPWMLSAIADPKRDGEQTAMEVLDVLRALRQSSTTGHGFRMVLCGSIGMHHVLGILKQRGYKNQPVNDMTLIEVPPLEPAVARELASRLLDGEGLIYEAAVPATISERTGGFPYYIHWVVSELRLRGPSSPIMSADIDVAMSKLLTAPHDPCDLRHFKRRIESYYPGQESVVFGVLDHVAANTEPVLQKELINVAKSAGAVDDNQIRELIRLLAVDHYLDRDSNGLYRFRHALLRRWWVMEQGLN